MFCHFVQGPLVIGHEPWILSCSLLIVVRSIQSRHSLDTLHTPRMEVLFVTTNIDDYLFSDKTTKKSNSFRFKLEYLTSGLNIRWNGTIQMTRCFQVKDSGRLGDQKESHFGADGTGHRCSSIFFCEIVFALFRILARRVIEATEQNIEIFPVKQ